jgi:hypothetical protein
VKLVVAVGVAAAVLAATGCMGGEEPPRVTLTASACAYDGPESVEGTLELELENGEDAIVLFDLVRIEPPGSFAALERHATRERQRIENGEGQIGAPAFVTPILSVGVDPGEVGVLTSALDPGTYAVSCTLGEPATAVWAAGPFEAT